MRDTFYKHSHFNRTDSFNPQGSICAKAVFVCACVCVQEHWITVIWVWWVITCSCYIVINELVRAGKTWKAEAFFAYNEGQERCHLMHENTHAKSKSSVWICRADKVVIIAISVSALIVLITLNWLLLSWSIITCDLSVTRLWEFSGVVGNNALSACYLKSLSKGFYRQQRGSIWSQMAMLLFYRQES